MVQPKGNPLVARKRNLPPKQTSFRPQPNALISGHPQNLDDSLAKDAAKLKEFQAMREANGGWSETRPDATEYPLVTTKRELREAMRYHIMRFNRSEKDAPVDPTDQDQFPRPVTLHRRDARTLPSGRAGAEDGETPPPTVDEAEAERIAKEKAERDAQRAIDLAQIAPVVKTNEPKQAKQDKKKQGVSVYYPRHSEEQKKASGIRYEETLPWHLEDADGKNVWVGQYIAALSELNVALVIHNNGFRMIPLERYYKFNHKSTFQQMSLEQAEKIMGTNASEVGRWVMQDKEKMKEEAIKRESANYLRGGARVKVESEISRSLPKSERMDDNEIDMEGEEFQDDDETPGFEADDEDSKDTKDRLRRDHLNANLFGDAQEDVVDKEEEKEKQEELRNKLFGKKTRKVLIKRDEALEYETDDSESDNPFYESSDSDSDEDKEKEKAKEAEDKKAAEEAKKPADPKDKAASGANSKATAPTAPTAATVATATPAAKQKAPDPTKKVKSLKRPASPNPSESSGNESSRKVKKIKKSLPGLSANASRATTPMPVRPRNMGGFDGAASDGEGTAGEGSDRGLKPKKIKLKGGTGPKGTPVGSRAGSPAPPAAAGKSSPDTVLRPVSHQVALAVSPGKPPAATTSGAAPSGSAVPVTTPITGEEIKAFAQNYPNGIKPAELLTKHFAGRVGDNPGQMRRKDWTILVKVYMNYTADKGLVPKPE
jgi:transcription initiation factor TFIIF subunit alpha